MDIKSYKTQEVAYIGEKDISNNSGKSCKENVRKRVVGGRLLQLPLPLIYEILLRLHIETLFSCKCACKTFYNILTDPQFPEMRLAKDSNIGRGLVIQDRRKLSDVLLVYNYNHDTEGRVGGFGSNCVSPRPCQTFSMPAVEAKEMNYVGSYNGLFCVRFKLPREPDLLFYICNPILGEFLALPRDMESILASGFGFCPETKQYKVLRFFTPSLCKIHTVGVDYGWRTIINPPPYPYTLASFDSSFKGHLHWTFDMYTFCKDFICSFNLETEQTSFLPTPIHLKLCNDIGFVQTGSLGGLFCIGYVLDCTYYQICVMKDYGVHESWTLDFNIDLTLVSGLEKTNLHYHVRKFSDSGDLFFVGVTKSIICYNVHKGTLTDLVTKKDLLVGITPFVPSLISLKDIVGIAFRGNVEVVQRKMVHSL